MYIWKIWNVKFLFFNSVIELYLGGVHGYLPSCVWAVYDDRFGVLVVSYDTAVVFVIGFYEAVQLGYDLICGYYL